MNTATHTLSSGPFSTTFLTLLRDIQTTADAFLARGSYPWYRGHRSADWTLTSTLHRHALVYLNALKVSQTDDDRMQYLLGVEKEAYYRFRREAWPYLSAAERTDWGILNAMQHFSLPTRLLDWTQSFACALFFAQRRRNHDETAAIWIVSSEEMNEITVGRRGLLSIREGNDVPQTMQAAAWHPAYASSASNLPSVAAIPIFTNPRMTVQQSAFTLMGNSFMPLEMQNSGALLSKGVLRKITLAPDTYEDANVFLALAGAGPSTYFPDLAGLAEDHECRTIANLRFAHKQYPGVIDDTTSQSKDV